MYKNRERSWCSIKLTLWKCWTSINFLQLIRSDEAYFSDLLPNIPLEFLNSIHFQHDGAPVVSIFKLFNGILHFTKNSTLFWNIIHEIPQRVQNWDTLYRNTRKNIHFLLCIDISSDRKRYHSLIFRQLTNAVMKQIQQLFNKSKLIFFMNL